MTASESTRECHLCGADDVPLRNILMAGGARHMLCESCFEDCAEAGKVSPRDARIVTQGGM